MAPRDKRRRWCALWAVAAALSACTFDDSAPASAVIRCTSTAECPPGFGCREALGRCVPNDDPDQQPPGLRGAVLLTPGAARAGARVQLFFRVDETLAAPPEAAIVAAGQTIARFEPLAQDLAEGEHRFEYRVLGTEPEGAHAVLISLLDARGNEAERVSAGSLTLDFTPPRLVEGSLAVEVSPLAGSPVGSDGTLSDTGAVRVTLSLDEAVGEAPVLRATNGAVAFVYTGAAGNTHAFSGLVPSASVAQGQAPLQLTAVDEVGNQSVLALAPGRPLEVDSLAPAAVFAGLDSGVVFMRSPWGHGARPPHFEVVGGPGSAPPGTTVILTDADPTRELARAVVDAAGGFGPLDTAGDRDVLLLTPWDSAGNRGETVRVRRSEWVATLAGKVAGADFPNPHRFLDQPVAGIGLEGTASIERGAETGLGAPDAGLVVTRGGVDWALRTFLAPQPRYFLAAPNPRAGKIFAVSASPTAGTWAFTGSDWQRVPTSDPESDGDPSPGPTEQGWAMAWNPEGERLLVFGPRRAVNQPAQLWEWTGGSWSLVTADARPGGPACSSSCAAWWDLTEHALLIADPGTAGLPMWSWRPSEGFVRLPPRAPPTYSPVDRPCHAYDPSRGQFVMFGGATAGLGLSKLTWVHSGGQWTQATASANDPFERVDCVMAFSPHQRSLYMLGGQADFFGNPILIAGPRHRWTGSEWRSDDPTPFRRRNAAMVADPGTGLLVVNPDDAGTTLAFWPDGGLATLASTRPQPAGRANHCQATTPAGDLLVFGGVSASGSPNNELWHFNGGNWRLLSASGPAPRSQCGLAVSPSGEITLFGGRGAINAMADTWRTTIADGGWTPFDAGAPPPARYQFGFAWVPSLGGYLATAGGGSSAQLSDSWLLVDGGWVELADAGHPQGAVHTLGPGSDGAPLTWAPPPDGRIRRLEVDGGWGLLADGGARPMADPAADVDRATGRVVSFGGTQPSPSQVTAFLRELDPAGSRAWETPPEGDRDGDGRPGPRRLARLSFGSGSRPGWLFGGSETTLTLPLTSDLWELRRAGLKPAHVVRLALSAHRPVSGSLPSRLTLRLRTGGSGQLPDGGLGAGATIEAWLAGGWRALATAAFPAEQPGELSWMVADPGEIAAILARGELYLRLSPVGVNGASEARLATGYLEVRLEEGLP